jgi:hypothetical protein
MRNEGRGKKEMPLLPNLGKLAMLYLYLKQSNVSDGSYSLQGQLNRRLNEAMASDRLLVAL